jgi:leader peptidase (prepilin peptidase)/N-methyltransferase
VGVPDWVWYIFIFGFGCCVGSFLNVVIYRLPRDKSLVKPGSACPSCGKHIRFYDNIPLISWLVLGTKCRYCKARISPRYFIIELLTGSVFTGLFILYFRTDLRPSAGPFAESGWFVYLLHIILLGSLIAASAIDLELWVIPISICWFATAVGLVGCGVGAYVIDPARITQRLLLPSTSDIVLKEVI